MKNYLKRLFKRILKKLRFFLFDFLQYKFRIRKKSEKTLVNFSGNANRLSVFLKRRLRGRNLKSRRLIYV